MRDRMAELLDGFDGSIASIFSTKNQVLELHEVPSSCGSDRENGREKKKDFCM